MKCPYNGFKECIVERCPSCNYTETTRVEVHGKYPAWMSKDYEKYDGYTCADLQFAIGRAICKCIGTDF